MGSSPGIIASTSLDDLRAMVAGLTTASDPTCTGCWPAVKHPQARSVFIAVWLKIPCTTSTTTVSVGGDVVTFLVRSTNSCKAGEQSAVAPQYSLVSVAQQDLPSDVLTLRVSHIGDMAGSTDLRLASSTVIDLAQPLAPLPSVDQRADEVRAVVKAAKNAAAKQLKVTLSALELVELGTRRWPDTNLGCASSASASSLPIPTLGYEIVLRRIGGTSQISYRADLQTVVSC
jgi:hypothetical protein